MPRLIVTRGADEGKQFNISGPTVLIGRDTAAKVRLLDTEISRRHAELVETSEGYRIRDLGSVNGTHVNGRAVQDCLLRSGDRVQVGQTVLVMVSEGTRKVSAPSLAEKINLITGQVTGSLGGTVVSRLGEAEGDRLISRAGQGEGEWLKRALGNLAVMYETATAISNIYELDKLLSRLLELVFRTIDADRGCILLDERDQPQEPDAAAFSPRAVYWRGGLHGSPPPGVEAIHVSRTLMDHVLRRKEGVLVSDAKADERFQTAPSIVRSHVREILCVPMRGRDQTVGLLYLDTTRETSAIDFLNPANVGTAFQEDHLKLAMAIAHLAGLAVEENRHYLALVQAERLAAVGTAMASLSHHIKNILQGLMSGTDVVKIGLADQSIDTISQGWRIVERNQKRIYELVLDMLSFSKDREPFRESCDTTRIVAEAVELLAAKAKENGIELVHERGPGSGVVLADPEAVHRIVLNLVGNALDAVEHDQGRVRVVTGKTVMADQVEIDVIDNGPGVPDEKVEEIFKPFVSSKGNRGTGLGLPVSRKLAREHGGDITLSKDQLGMTVFKLVLPVASNL
ncbi:MAG: FHA domain-containing protein [Planctomycetes bacterium]|nr:FHA domain-containing protein [Planctomycetota bacterium]